MPKRRREAVDDSDESDASLSDATDESTQESVQGLTGDSPREPLPTRRRRLRSHGSPLEEADVKADEDQGSESDRKMKWPVVLKTKKENNHHAHQSDDEYTDASSESSSSATSDYEQDKLEYSDGGFVVDSDENPLPSYSRRDRGRQRQRRRQRIERNRALQRRSTRGRRRNLKDDDDGDDDGFGSEENSFSEGSVAEELRELRSQESPRRRARNFRSRAPVDYAIPPPPTVEEVAQAAAVGAAERMDSAARARNARLRRLFDVRGPFGGQDVITVFSPTRSQLERLVVGQGDAPHPLPSASALAADVDPLAAGEEIDFSVVGGLDTYISKLKEMVSLPLLYPELYEKFGITPPRGVLFHGPPGTGKTLMARALAASHEQKVTFYMRKGADVLSKWIGESERQLRALFDEARANQPAIIFFDEIDGLAPVRSAKQEQHHASIVSTLLALMDGMDKRGQVVVIGATNRPDSVDPALRRPGRFDREFYFPLPDLDARLRILEIHTRKWSPQPEPAFLLEVAQKTKGFGGADIQALTTEAALLAIQRVFPQIYGSDKRLAVDTSQLHVRKQDFALALERAQPSTARSGGGLAEPLPQRVEPLLRDVAQRIRTRIDAQFSVVSAKKDAEAALFLDDTAFAQARAVKQFAQQRVHRPRLLLRGPPGMGQTYLNRAVSNMLEGVYVRELGLGAMFGSEAPTPETAVVSAVAEARQRAPACLLLPHLEEWHGSSHLVTLLEGLLRSLLPSEAVLVVGVASMETEELPLSDYFGGEIIDIKLDTSSGVLREFFSPLVDYIRRTPLECREAHELPKITPPPLPPAPSPAPAASDLITENSKPEKFNDKHSAVFSEKERQELRVRSQLKLKLGMLLDGFRTKYRRFRKPAVDEQSLVYLFEAGVAGTEQQYIRTTDDMILDRYSGRKYFNMDLETVEDRLWNGYYSEPQQFLEDIEMIYRDSVELSDRERMHKASEMLANAQVAIDDIVADVPFMEACRKLRIMDAKARLQELDAREAEESVERQSEVPESGEAKHDLPSQESHVMQIGSIISHPSQDLKSVSKAPQIQPEILLEAQTQEHDHVPRRASPSLSPLPQAPPSIEPKSFLAQNGPSTDTNASADVEMIHEQNGSSQNPPFSPSRPFVLDEDMLSKFLDKLVRRAAHFTLEQLEQLAAGLSDVAWRYRGDWDRTAMLHALDSRLAAMLPN